MAICEACGYESGYRHRCPHCDRKVCSDCFPEQGYFCSHGTIKAVPLDTINENNIVANKNYREFYIGE